MLVANSTVWGVPPIVGQNESPGPGGNVDPAGSTDCGEACISAAVLGRRAMYIAPGCIRQALMLPMSNGSTTAEQLASVWHSFGLRARVARVAPGDLARARLTLRRAGRFWVILGRWVLTDSEHWVLAYHSDGQGLRVMDPWTAAYVQYSRPFLRERAEGTYVELT
jgi:hypothetical protein